MKKTGMAKSDAKKLMGKMAAPGASAFGAGDAVAIDRREQRKRDQALGLVPFAVKLNSELIQQLQTLAKEQDRHINDITAEILNKGLKA